jgi:hypothetical protein
MAYQGQTARGRLVCEASLDECIASLAFIANKDPAACVTFESGAWGVVPRLWYVYESIEARDLDAAANGAAERVGWFAVISEGADRGRLDRACPAGSLCAHEVKCKGAF